MTQISDHSTTPDTTRRILWVDDEIEFLRAHILFLEDQDWVVDKATNGHDALGLVRKHDYDVVLLDEQMAGLDGLTTLQKLKAEHPRLFVVMVTKSEEERLMEEAIGRNIDGYVTKPVNPGQIVSLCRSLFNARSLRSNHLTSRYVRQYAENKARMLGQVTPADWERIHARLCGWDLDLAAAGQEGLFQTHNGQREETETLFLRYLENNWYSWMGRDRFKPGFVWDFLPKRVAPLLKEGRNLAVFLLSGLRTDQWLSMQGLLEGLFEPKLEHHWSLLPGVPETARVALLGAASPRVLSGENRDWSWPERSRTGDPDFVRPLLERGLRAAGIAQEFDVRCVRTAQEGKQLAARAMGLGSPAFVVVEFQAILQAMADATRGEEPSSVPVESFRDLARKFLATSGFYSLMRKLAQEGRTVLIASDHGTTLVSEAVEVFCSEQGPADFRIQFGKDISCDERHAFFMEHPPAAGLDGSRGAMVLARGEHYFTQPNKFQYYGTRHLGRLVSGGLSMHEMLVPVCLLTPG
jgi:DNA-binding NarL/FixJ family response regulator